MMMETDQTEEEGLYESSDEEQNASNLGIQVDNKMATQTIPCNGSGGSNGSNPSNGSQTDQEDIWDDSLLLESYNKSVRMVDAALKSLSTDPKAGGSKDVSHGQGSQSKSKGHNNRNKTKNDNVFHKSIVVSYRFNPSVGKFCRCPYSEDDKVYEAIIVQILSENNVVVKYFGYDNEETRSVSLLKESAGQQARDKQIKAAQVEAALSSLAQEEGLDSDSYTPSRGTFPGKKGPTKRSHSQSKEPSKQSIPTFNTPNTSSSNIPEGFKPGSGLPPLMPCPPILMPSSSGSSEENEALSSMLMSWYMSGYHTGYFQAMKRYRE